MKRKLTVIMAIGMLFAVLTAGACTRGDENQESGTPTTKPTVTTAPTITKAPTNTTAPTATLAPTITLPSSNGGDNAGGTAGDNGATRR